MGAVTEARTAAHAVEDAEWFRVLARSGYVANGVVHLILGVLTLAVAVGSDGASDQTMVFRAIAAAPLGFAALWALTVGFSALGLWQLVQSVLMRRRGDEMRAAVWGRRLGAWGQALVFLALGLIAAAVALGARPDAEATAEDLSSVLLEIWGGAVVLGLTGLGVAIGGVSFLVMGVRRSFENRMTLPDGRLGTTIRVLGIVGFVAKGVALTIVGILLLIATVSADADVAGGLDGAVQALFRLTLGPYLVAAVAAGLVCYGVFTVFRARYARLTWR
ncbi:DUF1206 domain-containing protein [Microbacterium invictum]|uniref:DUF1206 domain-containing protein n=1 Tax=Microbacterium invictum TaxID=515415 RepID=A0ABZ0V899_9MICO|nr:DUF1206 domain-containing protein [Microbacterium invictum]WQB69349.1 DUF1206 domain-containing protein [Microbacterium invictum]